MNDTEYLSNGKIVFHSYDALKKYCDDPNNPLDKVILGKEITTLNGLFENSWRTNEQFSGIENWDVSNVTNMSGMFWAAKSFNKPIGNWDVSNVTDMEGMFERAESFNQPLDNFTEKQKSSAEYKFDKKRYASEQEKLTKTSSNSAENNADKVIKLAELKKQGLLTDEEFEMMKADLLK